jgi:PadR family transcriptional regulator PadR
VPCGSLKAFLRIDPANLCLTFTRIAVPYVAMKHIAAPVDRELKKGSAELLILSLVEHRARHGYEISKLIDERSDGVLNVASFYPLLYRLEKRGWIAGRWVEKAGQRRRRYYRLTSDGKQILKTQRATWLDFVNAIHRITEAENA